MHLFFIFILIFTLSAQHSLNGGDGSGEMALPYYETVLGGFHPEMAVYLNGTVPEVSNGFKVDFGFAKHEGADLAFHFNPRFKESNELVINTFQSGRWGKEEKYQNPFRKGEHFEVIFTVTEVGYQILVNRKLFYVFRHRIPPQSVHFIEVSGDLELQSLNVMTAPMIGNLVTTSPEIYHFAVPYYKNVPGGLHPGMAVYLNGTVPEVSNRFGVDFGFAKHEGFDLAFHFNPRFKESHELVINTFQSGRWGKQERYQNPFWKGEHFEVIFIVTEAEYQILVNRDLMYVFRHRIPPQNVQFIQVAGDLELHSLNMMAAPVMTVPYRGNIPGGLGTNRTITVRGFILKNATRFEIIFMAGQDIPLHINLHMKPWRGVVRNSFLNGKWGSEERNFTVNPFQPGQYFKLSIHCDNNEFKFSANDQPFFNYTHHYVPIKNIRTLEMDGDVTLSYIKYYTIGGRGKRSVAAQPTWQIYHPFPRCGHAEPIKCIM